MSSNWKQRHQAQHQSRQMMYSDQSSWTERSLEEMDRLQELREKQQPWVDWTVNWDRFILKNNFSKDDPFANHKVDYFGVVTVDDTILSVLAQEGNRGYTMPLWTSYRVKATLRAGKMLPYSIWASLKPQSQWKTIERLISEAGELPDLAPEVLQAVSHVRNQGYKEALGHVMAGEQPEHNSAAWHSERRALDLVAAILRDWEGEDYRARKGAQREIVEEDEEDMNYG